MPKRKPELRLPFATHYYSRAGGEHVPRLVRHGACGSDDVALRQAFWHVFRGEYTRAEVIDRKSGHTLWTVLYRPGGKAPEVRMGHREGGMVYHLREADRA